MILSLGTAIARYPNSFGNWASLLLEVISGTNEIAIVGENFSKIHEEILTKYIPNRVLMASATADNFFPLLVEKTAGRLTTIFLCRNYTCRNPVFSANELISLINSNGKAN